MLPDIALGTQHQSWLPHLSRYTGVQAVSMSPYPFRLARSHQKHFAMHALWNKLVPAGSTCTSAGYAKRGPPTWSSDHP